MAECEVSPTSQYACPRVARKTKPLLQLQTSLLFLVGGVLILIWCTSVNAGDPPEIATCPNVKNNLVIAYKKNGIKWEGWGTALAWWANWAGGLKLQSDFNFLMDAIFRLDKGLGLNIVRYNIGGGGYSPLAHPQFVGHLRFRAMPGYKWTENSKFNPDFDANQRKVLLASRDRGVNTFEAFSNSPPAYMTITKSFTGSREPYTDNLLPEKYRSFADYLVQVLRYYKERWGIEFHTLEPINEAIEGHWLLGGRQEGCNFKLESIVKLIQITNHVLVKNKLKSVLAAPDSLGYNSITLLRAINQDTVKRISQINVHSYETGPIRKNYTRQVTWRFSIARNAARLKKKVVVSEWGPYGMKSTPFEYGLTLAKQVMMDINVLKASSWTYWQAVEQSQKARRWGLIFVNMATQGPMSYELGSQYYSLMQFSKWIRPGVEILQVDISCVHGLVAAYDPRNKRLVVVIANFLKYDDQFSLNVQFRTRNGGSSMTAYRTSSVEKYSNLGTWGVYVPGSIQVQLWARSITTFVITNVDPV